MLPGNEACAPQLLGPQALECMLPNQRRLHTTTEEALLPSARESPCSNEIQKGQKENKQIK